MKHQPDSIHLQRPPVILVGGVSRCCLVLARALSGIGVPTYFLGRPNAETRFSRYAKTIYTDVGYDLKNAWKEYLVGPASDGLRGAVLFTCDDDALELIIQNREELSKKFILDVIDVNAQKIILDKLATYRAAVDAGVATPAFWDVATIEDIERLRADLRYPLVIKPKASSEFPPVDSKRRKYLLAQSYDDLMRSIDIFRAANCDFVLMDKVPGPDSFQWSYFTYIDDDGHPLYQFVKQSIRRFPINEGGNTYQISREVRPDLQEPALRFLGHIGLKGLANVTFKFDERDNQFKLIECNGRFTAVERLLQASGIDQARVVYGRLTGLDSCGPPKRYTIGTAEWNPIRDVAAFLELRRRGELTLGAWLKDVWRRDLILAGDWQWTNPLPLLAHLTGQLKARF